MGEHYICVEDIQKITPRRNYTYLNSWDTIEYPLDWQPPQRIKWSRIYKIKHRTKKRHLKKQLIREFLDSLSDSDNTL